MGQSESKAGEFVTVHQGPSGSDGGASAELRSPVLDKLATLRKEVPMLESESRSQRTDLLRGAESALSGPTSVFSATPSSRLGDHGRRRSSLSIDAAGASPTRLTDQVGASLDAMAAWHASHSARIREAQSKVHARIDVVDGLARDLAARANAVADNAARSAGRLKDLPALADAVDALARDVRRCVESYEALYVRLGECVAEKGEREAGEGDGEGDGERPALASAVRGDEGWRRASADAGERRRGGDSNR